MTMTSPINIIHNSNGSKHSAALRPSPHGFDRAIQNLGIALVKWSRARTERAAVSHEEYERLMEANTLRQQRESNALHLPLRVGL